MKNRIKDELEGVGIFIGVIWLVFLVDWTLPTDLRQWGVAPRTISGLLGVITMPFLHGDWQHLTGNTVPLVVLLCLLAGSRANSVAIVTGLTVFSGSLLWLLGPSGTVHVGASGLIYALIAFLLVAGFSEKRPAALIVAVAVGIMYGTTILNGVLPFTVGDGISWQGHMAGAIAGSVMGRFAVEPAESWQLPHRGVARQ